MTSRSKSAVRGFETEIERSREEGNWKKAVDLALQLKQRSPQHESLANFLIGEGKLEAFLEEWAPCKDNEERAQRELGEARNFLTAATDEAGKRAGVALDAHLLLGKLAYACGLHAAALQHYAHAELDTLTEKELPVRSLRIVAESFAIKGLCVEALAASTGAGSRYKAAERENELVRALELASDLTLQHVQRTGLPPPPILGAVLLRGVALHVRAGRGAAALARSRALLAAVEAAGLAAARAAAARQLAELLLRAPLPQYAPPQAPKLANKAEGPWKPKKYTAINQFVPANSWEELVLALLVGEALAARDAVLSQSAEFAAARDLSLATAVQLIDLLALAVTRSDQLCLVLESLERAMKFSFGSAHVWRQRALATAAAAQRAPRRHQQHHHYNESGWSHGVRALGVCRRALRLSPRDTALHLLAAHTAYQLGWIEEGIALAETARALEAGAGRLRARACHALAAGHQARAQKSNDRLEKEAASAACIEILLEAVKLDDNDHLAFYQLALQYARLGMLNEAMDACRSCLTARSECAGGLRLCIALWSCACAGPRQTRALAAARLARQHYPRAEWPRAALAALQVSAESGEAALATGKELLSLLTGAEEADGGGGYAELDALSDSVRDDVSARGVDAVSIRAESISASRAERALSDTASSLSRAGAGAGGAGEGRGAARAAAWLTLAELCLRLGRVAAAAGCVSEAACLTPCSHLVLHTRGLVHAASEEWEAARGCFQSALALHPTHVDSIVQLGAAYYRLGWLRLAEKALRDAVSLEPRRADAWRRLALVLWALGEPLPAADCACAALALQPAAPRVPAAL